jgi:hypothetical protein
MDNWQWNSILADFWFLKTLSLCGFYCLLGRCLKPYLLFCLDTKKEAKKVKTAPVSLEKLSFGRLKSSNLLKFDDPFIKVKGHDTSFNFEQGRFLTAFHAYFSAHRPKSNDEEVIRNDQWIDFFTPSTVDNWELTADYYCLLPIVISDCLNAFSLNTFILAVPYCFQQLTIDNW